MTRAALVGLVVGILGLAATALLGRSDAQPVMPSYLAAWLFWSALPIGALPLVMLFELLGQDGTATNFVRPLLLAWPAAVLLAIPLLLGVTATYPWAAPANRVAGFAERWLAPEMFVLRACVYLAIWVVLTLLFLPARPVGERRPQAACGLMLHLFVGTLAGIDWSMSMDPHWHSTAYGLLFVAAQLASAAAAGVLIAAWRLGWANAARDPATHNWMVPQFGALLLVPTAIWGFLAFVQFLVIWSADLPDEIGAYITRSAAAGQPAEWFLVLAGLLLPVVAALTGRFRLLTAGAALALLAHLVEMFWLTTPAARGALTLDIADVTSVVGVGGIVVGSTLLLSLRASTWLSVGAERA